MIIFKFHIKILLAIIFSTVLVYGQTIKLVRTDVDTSRDNFVTATYLFGIDVMVDSITNCTGAAFELQYNQTKYVHLSQWSVNEFGNNPTSIVIPQIDFNTDLGIIHIGILSELKPEDSGFNNPKVLHLEFAVTQAAPNGELLTFSFINPQAAQTNNGIRRIINLNSQAINYTIHSFVNVWPGDTDNDGEVTTKDISQVMLYLGDGSSNKSLRSFKRPSPSTMWYAQRVLAWDSSSVTYADCDGNGEITMVDALIIALNYGKTHPVLENRKRENEKLEYFALEPDLIRGNVLDEMVIQKTANSITIPIKINSKDLFIASSARISYENISNDYIIKGVERGNIFTGNKSFFISTNNETDKYFDIAFGNFDNITQKSGILANLILEPKEKANYQQYPIISQLMGISPTGLIFPISQVTDVEENYSDNEFQIIQTVNEIVIHNNHDFNPVSSISFYNIQGNQVLPTSHFKANNNEILMNTSQLQSGCYWLLINGVKENQLHKIIIVK
jgi:hypothetical protein